MSQQIEEAIARLRQTVIRDIQLGWYSPVVVEEATTDFKRLKEFSSDRKAAVNEKGYIVFPKGRQVKWLVQKIIVPESLKVYPLGNLALRLVLTWWAEATQIYVNGQLVREGDLFDSSARILITNNAKAGAEYIVTIRLVSPNHDIGALMRSHLVYENTNGIDPGMVADELTVLLKYNSQFAPENLKTIAAEINKLDWHNVADRQKFDRDLEELRSRLLPLAGDIKQRHFHLLGHAHLDMAWLWRVAETYEVAQNTFQSVLNLQREFPQLTFGHTSPALYQWIEEHRPQLFAAIQTAFKQGKWEILGGMWIEPEVNLVSGESLIRQLLYGQEYFRDKFGEIAKVAWLPDSFGFTWQLPQIFQQCGIEYFVTGKLHWNDTTEFPHGCFWWESPDGTRILTTMSPPNITGVMDTNPITMANYAISWETQTGLQDVFWLPGVGDRGGGPTRDMLEVASKWEKSPFFPEIKFTNAIDYLKKIAPQGEFPVWQDELYLELHRGCYTTHADQKKFNRYCEGLLYEAELFATLAENLNKDPKTLTKPDRQQQIDIAWKKVLFNQFHDILPGTSIPEVFADANRDWQAAIAIGENILQQALQEIASHIKLPTPPTPEAKPFVVFNSLNWLRSGIVTLEVEDTKHHQYLIYDLDNNPVATQLIADNKLIFRAENIPSVGYRLFWLWQTKINPSTIQDGNSPGEGEYKLENQYLRVKINSTTGDIDSIYDKQEAREILKEAGNKLQAFVDKGQYWDAWNIDPEYEQHPLPDAILESIQWLNNGEVEQRIRVIKKIAKSQFQQDYILEKQEPILKIASAVDWQETHVVVKATFPLNLASDFVTYEIPCGAIARPTKPQTAAEKAKWEVSALKWVDLTDNKQNYGVSLLNDCKYGYDSQSDRLRITLLRSPVWPNPQADRGKHQFTYAIYPHKKDWKTAKTTHKSCEFNLPLQTIEIDEVLINNRQLSPIASFLEIKDENIILMALKSIKQGESMARFYECQGKPANLRVRETAKFEIQELVDCLENPSARQYTDGDRANIKPWQIITVKLTDKQ